MSEAEGTGSPRRSSVLLVDDDDDVARVLTRFLEMDGWEVHRARTGTDAVGMLAGLGDLGAAVVDLVLPGAGGLEVVREIRRWFAACRIVAVTGLAEPAMAKVFREAGADVFLPKPVELTQLREAIAPRR